MINLQGKQFTRLKVLTISHRDLHGSWYWKVKCKCGKVKVTSASNLLHGSVTSCGCLQREKASKIGSIYGKQNKKHGHSCGGKISPTYRSWLCLRRRCNDKNWINYSHYGGRGIKVCNRWSRSFKNFLLDMGIRPTGKTIDRVNNSGNYTPSNCKWSTWSEQNQNRSFGTH